MRGAGLPARRSASCSMPMASATPSAVSNPATSLSGTCDVTREVQSFSSTLNSPHMPRCCRTSANQRSSSSCCHAARAQRRFVQRREADRVDLAALRKVEREPQRIEHERAVGRRGLRRRECRCVPARPFQAGDRRARFGGVGPRAASASRARRPPSARPLPCSHAVRSAECAHRAAWPGWPAPWPRAPGRYPPDRRRRVQWLRSFLVLLAPAALSYSSLTPASRISLP